MFAKRIIAIALVLTLAGLALACIISCSKKSDHTDSFIPDPKNAIPTEIQDLIKGHPLLEGVRNWGCINNEDKLSLGTWTSAHKYSPYRLNVFFATNDSEELSRIVEHVKGDCVSEHFDPEILVPDNIFTLIFGDPTRIKHARYVGFTKNYAVFLIGKNSVVVYERRYDGKADGIVTLE
jgi:hypothetical protein